MLRLLNVLFCASLVAFGLLTAQALAEQPQTVQAAQPARAPVVHEVSFEAPRAISCAEPSNAGVAAPSCSPTGTAYCPATLEWRTPGRSLVQQCEARCTLIRPAQSISGPSGPVRCSCTVDMSNCS